MPLQVLESDIEIQLINNNTNAASQSILSKSLAESSQETDVDSKADNNNNNKKQKLTSKVWDHFERFITGKNH